LKGGQRRTARGQPEDRRMKFVIAVIKPFKLDAVREALVEAGVQGLTVSEVRGFGRQKGHTEIYRGAEYDVSLVPKIKIEVAVADGQTAQVVEAIRDAGTTDTIGDGKIFVLDIIEAMRIRTGETGETAL
jgi:nitrogen regulatory protein P-II 2